MRRKILTLIVVGAALCSIIAADPTTPVKLTLRTDVPENYGIVFPEGLRIDSLVMSLKGRQEETMKLLDDGSYHIGSFADYPDGLDLELLYYGNFSSPYDVFLSVSASEDGWEGLTASETIPVTVAFNAPDAVPEGVDLDFHDESTVRLTVDRIGPQRGLEVLDMKILWNDSLSIVPGAYATDLNIELTAI